MLGLQGEVVNFNIIIYEDLLLLVPQSSINKQVSNILKLLFELLRTPRKTILKNFE